MELVKRRLEPGAAAEPIALELGVIYRAHAATVWRWARRLLGSEVDVDDVLHEVFLVVQRRLPEYQPEGKLTTWLYAITVRVVQHRRRRDRWRRLWRREDQDFAAEVAAQGPTPLQALESRRAAELTYRLLDRLSERDRTVLVLFELEGLSGEEIAAITGQSTGNVWVRLSRARARFLAAHEACKRERKGEE